MSSLNEVLLRPRDVPAQFGDIPSDEFMFEDHKGQILLEEYNIKKADKEINELRLGIHELCKSSSEEEIEEYIRMAHEDKMLSFERINIIRTSYSIFKLAMGN